MNRGYQTQMRFGPGLTPVVKALLIANTAIFLFVSVVLQELISPPAAAWIYRHFGLIPSAVFPGGEVWQLFTYAFLHEDLGHLFWNMVTLWMFGAEIEASWGSRVFLRFYLLGALGGGLAVLATGGHLTIGASGALLAVVVVYGCQFADRTIHLLFPPVPLKAKWLAFGWVAFDLILFLKGGSSNIAYMAHFGGALTGYLYWKSPIKFSRRKGSGSNKPSEKGPSLLEQLQHAWKRRQAKRYLRLLEDREREFERQQNDKGPTVH